MRVLSAGCVDSEPRGSLPDENMAKPGSPTSIMPYYHCMYSCIRQTVGESPSRKVYATTYTPEIGGSIHTPREQKPSQETTQLTKLVPLDIEQKTDPLKIGNEVSIGEKSKRSDGQAEQTCATHKDKGFLQNGRIATVTSTRLPLEGGVTRVSTSNNDTNTINSYHGDSRSLENPSGSCSEGKTERDAIMKDSKPKVNNNTCTTQGKGGSKIENTEHVVNSVQNGSGLSNKGSPVTCSADVSVHYSPLPSGSDQPSLQCYGNVPLDMSYRRKSSTDECHQKKGSKQGESSSPGRLECGIFHSESLTRGETTTTCIVRSDNICLSHTTSAECKQTVCIGGPISHKCALEQSANTHDQGSGVTAQNTNGIQHITAIIQNQVTQSDQKELIQTNGISVSTSVPLQNVNVTMKGGSKARNLDKSDTRITRVEDGNNAGRLVLNWSDFFIPYAWLLQYPI